MARVNLPLYIPFKEIVSERRWPSDFSKNQDRQQTYNTNTVSDYCIVLLTASQGTLPLAL